MLPLVSLAVLTSYFWTLIVVSCNCVLYCARKGCLIFDKLGGSALSHCVGREPRSRINDFCVPIAAPVQPLAAAVTKWHELPLHRDFTPGAHIICGPSRTGREDHEFGHGLGDAEVCKSEKHMPESGVWNRGTRELACHNLYLTFRLGIDYFCQFRAITKGFVKCVSVCCACPFYKEISSPRISQDTYELEPIACYGCWPQIFPVFRLETPALLHGFHLLNIHL